MNGSALVESHDLTLPTGVDVTVKVEENDVKHYQSGHTYDEMAVVPANFNNTDYRSMWPVGTTPADIQAKVGKALGKAVVQQAIADKLRDSRRSTRSTLCSA